MYPDTHLPPPVSPQAFYIMLGLSRHEAHGYTLRSLAANDSLGGVKMANGTIYPLLRRMIEAGFIKEAGFRPAGKSDIERLHYRLTTAGQDRLKQELQHMKHAVTIGESAGFFNDELPLELQKLLRELT